MKCTLITVAALSLAACTGQTPTKTDEGCPKDSLRWKTHCSDSNVQGMSTVPETPEVDDEPSDGPKHPDRPKKDKGKGKGKDKPKSNASGNNGKGGNDGKGGKNRNTSKNSR